MTDRELLEAAAKAAGHDLNWSGTDCWLSEEGESVKHWSPLTDDGDALRLAVKLKMIVDCDDEPSNPDRYAAARRAIVRAAAALAKGTL